MKDIKPGLYRLVVDGVEYKALIDFAANDHTIMEQEISATTADLHPLTKDTVCKFRIMGYRLHLALTAGPDVEVVFENE